MRKFLGMIAAIGTFAGTAQAVTYDPAQQGPFAANFTYGYLDETEIVTYTAANYATGSACQISTGASSSCLQGGPSNFLGVYFTPVDGQASTAYLYASDVTLHPGAGAQAAGVIFNAPTTGTYTVAGTLRAVDAAAGNGVLYQVGTLPIGFLAPGASFDFDYSVGLSAGDQLYFFVGNAGSYSFDTTGLRLAISTADVPEPATWAMMIGGFGLAGGSLRRRRTVAALRIA